MIGLPKATEFNKRIPKQKFYENLTVTPALRDAFKNQIKTIYWRNKIAPSTVNLAQGKNVTEIEVFEIKLNEDNLDEMVLKQIDREIPYHILFLVERAGKFQTWIGYKEATQSGNNAFKVNRYYHTEWLTEKDLHIKMEGLSVDSVYENFVIQVAGDELIIKKDESLENAVSRSEEKIQLQKQIEFLKKEIKKEKQLNRQMNLNSQLKVLKKKYNDL